MYPSTRYTLSNLLDNFLALSKLKRFEPFLKKSVSGEFIYFAKFLLLSNILPPIPIGLPEISFIGKTILSLNLSTNFFFLSSK